MSRIASRPATVNHYGRVPIGWEVKPLGQVSINHDRKRKPLSKIQRQQRPGPFPYYGAAKVFDYIDDYIFDGTYCLIAEDGSVVTPDGHPVMQLATGKFWANNHTHILEGKAPATTRYLYYYLKGFDITGYITGAAQPKITQENLNRIPVLVPPEEVLGRTAAILSAYDDLIENNLRRIKILEEMAQALYREWFVNFRFPGHGSVRMVDSKLGKISEGWEVGHFSDLAQLVREGIRPSNFKEETFAHFSFPAFDSERMPWMESGGSIRSSKYLVVDNSILLSKLNPRIPRIWLPHAWHHYRSVASTEFLVLVPKQTVNREFLFGLCTSHEFLDEFAGLALGTSTSHQRVKPDDLLGLQAVVPSASVVRRYRDIVAPILAETNTLRLVNRNLRRTRDLLLPRLISGELDVSELDIDTEGLQ